jgi:PLP dependent protein
MSHLCIFNKKRIMTTEIASNLIKIKSSLPQQVTLVAVSKTKPIEDLLVAYQAGQRIFGENKVQEMCAKQVEMPKDIAWHMIGHLQSNKVKFIVPFVDLIHGIDTEKLLQMVAKEAEKIKREVNVLIQIHVAKEETKFGFSSLEALELLQKIDFKDKFPYVKVKGLMAMASFVDNQAQLKTEFIEVKSLFDRLKSLHLTHLQEFDTLSMGMSGDYPLAIDCGSNMVRVGSSIFGHR